MEALLKNVSPRSIIMAMGGVSLSVAAALVCYGLWPEFIEYRQSQQTLEILDRRVESGDSTGKEIEKVKNEISLLDRNLHGDAGDLPESRVGAYLIGRLQEISRQNHMNLLGVRPGTGTTLGSVKEVPFEVEVSGDYFDLYAWTQDLAKDLRFMAISHFTISPLDSSKRTSAVKASFTIVSYRENEDG
jgi:Tfp pilus assembly protein PilO